MNPPRPAAELGLVTLGVWLALIAIPISLGGIGLSWDALNHHIYLGWVADKPRFGQDLLAASFQSYQYPYLYWPAYQLLAHGFSGVTAGIVLVTLDATLIPALWLIARCCIPDSSWHAAAMRAGAVVLAMVGQVSLSMMDTTANDVLASAPLAWAVALAMLALQPAHGWLSSERAIGLSGLCAGVSVAFKLSNGPLALVLPVLWALAAAGWRPRLVHVMRGGIWTLAGFALAYGYWGWLLWQEFGNPVFPFMHASFEPLRALLGWRR